MWLVIILLLFLWMEFIMLLGDLDIEINKNLVIKSLTGNVTVNGNGQKYIF